MEEQQHDSSEDDLGHRKRIEIAAEVRTELKVLNDVSKTDAEMLDAVRQVVATLAKQIKDGNREVKEVRKSCEGAHKKAEQAEGKIMSTRKQLLNAEACIEHTDEQQRASEARHRTRLNTLTEEVAAL